MVEGTSLTGTYNTKKYAEVNSFNSILCAVLSALIVPPSCPAKASSDGGSLLVTPSQDLCSYHQGSRIQNLVSSLFKPRKLAGDDV
jgi:hypothetical protein